MKKAVIFLIAVLLSVNSYAWCVRDKCKEEAKKRKLIKIEEQKSEEPEKCFKALRASGQELYIYEMECVEIRQIAIINESEGRVYEVKDLELLGYYKYIYDEQLLEYIEENFPGMSPLQFFRK